MTQPSIQETTNGYMTPGTRQMIEVAVRNDTTIPTEIQQAIFDAISRILRGQETAPLRRTVSRKDLCVLTRRTPQWLDWMAKAHPGVLVKVQAPGSNRAIGYTYESVQAFLNGTTVKEVA